MKEFFKFVLFGLCVTIVTLSINANTMSPLEFKFSFDENDYKYISLENGETVIETSAVNHCYSDDAGPCLPRYVRRIILPKGHVVADFSVDCTEKHLVKSNITLASNPKDIPVSYSNENCSVEDASYSLIEYPAENCSLEEELTVYGAPFQSISITPFKYDAREKKLYFIDSFKVKINFKESDRFANLSGRIGEMGNLFKSWVINPEDVDEVLATAPAATLDYPDTMDYLLITTSGLADAFKPLVELKKRKRK